MIIKKLFEANNPSKKDIQSFVSGLWADGYRSIGPWCGLKGIYPDTLYSLNCNDHQVEHAQKVYERYGVFIIMKEAYAEKWRIHSPISFAYFFLCNIQGKIDAGQELDGHDKELKAICQSIISEDI